MKKLITFLFVYVIFATGAKAQTSYTICGGSSATLQAPNPQNLASPHYTMTPGNIVTSNGVYVVSPTVTTTYTFLTQGTNSASAVVTTTSNITVNVNPQPSAVPTLTQTTCTSTVNAFNLNLTWTPSGSTGYTVSWTPIPNAVVYYAQQAATGIAPGSYTAVITADGGCSTVTSFTVLPQPTPVSLQVSPPLQFPYFLTCYQPTLNMGAVQPGNTYTWSHASTAPITGSVANISNVGTWTLTGTNPSSGCSNSITFSVAQNTSVPSSTLTPLLQNITCSLNSITNVSVIVSPTVNTWHQVMSPQGGTFSVLWPTSVYTPVGPGTYTHCAVDAISGCSTCKTFTVTSNQGFPTYSVTSPQNFTLGCTTKSVAIINIINAVTQPTAGGPVSYMLLGPQSGTLSPISAYTVNVPGTWTVVVHDNTNNCETRTAISILSNTFAPDISAIVPNQTLSCIIPVTTLQGMSQTNNVSYLWSFAGTPGTVPGQTISVITNSAAPTQTLVNNYTLTITDNNNTCKSTSIIPIYQNIFKPNVAISALMYSITCINQGLSLTNISSTGIPPNMSPVMPVIGYFWEGPSPQTPLQVSTTYYAQTPGVYTLTGKDLNNGCISTGTITITDARMYPAVSAPPPFLLPCPGQVIIFPVISGPQPSYGYTWNAPPNATISLPASYSVIVNSPGFYTVTVKDNSNSCSTQVVVPVYACVGLNENSLSNGMSVFPNPGSGIVNIHFDNVPANAMIEVFSSLGTLISRKQVATEKMQVDIQQQPSGIYLLRVQDGENTLKIFKVVKQ
jgi:hypothetical protein